MEPPRFRARRRTTIRAAASVCAINLNIKERFALTIAASPPLESEKNGFEYPRNVARLHLEPRVRRVHRARRIALTDRRPDSKRCSRHQDRVGAGTHGIP